MALLLAVNHCVWLPRSFNALVHTITGTAGGIVQKENIIRKHVFSDHNIFPAHRFCFINVPSESWCGGQYCSTEELLCYKLFHHRNLQSACNSWPVGRGWRKSLFCRSLTNLKLLSPVMGQSQFSFFFFFGTVFRSRPIPVRHPVW